VFLAELLPLSIIRDEKFQPLLLVSDATHTDHWIQALNRLIRIASIFMVSIFFMVGRYLERKYVDRTNQDEPISP